MCAGKGGDEVDREQPGPIFRRRVSEQRMLVDPGIIDDDIEWSVLRYDRLRMTYLSNLVE